jgi:hypothetical protein
MITLVDMDMVIVLGLMERSINKQSTHTSTLQYIKMDIQI